MYAGTRQPLAHPDGRVTPLTLDVTNPAQIQAAAEQVDALDLLINNAGIGCTTTSATVPCSRSTWPSTSTALGA